MGSAAVTWPRFSPASPIAKWSAVCDVFKPNRDKAAAAFAENRPKPETYVDYRRVLERKDIDAVLVAARTTGTHS